MDPLTEAIETVREAPPTRTVNEDVGAVVAFSGSLYVSVNVVPVVPSTDELMVGAVWSTVELLVTNLAVNVIASLPEVS